MLPNYQFFSLSPHLENTTLFVSLCTNECSGCMHTGDRLRASKFPNADHMRVSLSKYRGNQGFFDKVRPQREYQYLVFTGCKFSSYDTIFSIIKQKLTIAREVRASVILPVHLMPGNYATFQKDVIAEISPFVQAVEIFACDLESIGFPTMLASHTDLEEKQMLSFEHQQYSGLLYLPKMGARYPVTIQPDWLEAYFNLLSQTSQAQPVRCLVIQSSSLWLDMAKEADKYGVSIDFSERIAPPIFEALLKNIKKNNGVVGINGIISFIQAVELGCNTLYCQAFDSNRSFYMRLSNYFTSSKLNKMAEVLLGQSSDYALLKETGLVPEVMTELKRRFQIATSKFSSLISPKRDAEPRYYQGPGIFAISASLRAKTMLALAQTPHQTKESEHGKFISMSPRDR